MMMRFKAYLNGGLSKQSAKTLSLNSEDEGSSLNLMNVIHPAPSVSFNSGSTIGCSIAVVSELLFRIIDPRILYPPFNDDLKKLV